MLVYAHTNNLSERHSRQVGQSSSAIIGTKRTPPHLTTNIFITTNMVAEL